MAKSFDKLVKRTTTKETRERAGQRAQELVADLCFRQKVDEGLRQLDEGEGIEHEEVKRRLGKRLR